MSYFMKKKPHTLSVRVLVGAFFSFFGDFNKFLYFFASAKISS